MGKNVGTPYQDEIKEIIDTLEGIAQEEKRE